MSEWSPLILPSDTILVFYQEPDYKLDTILLSKGKFTYTITPDTFTIFSLLLGEKQILPIYADKGESVTLNGMAGKIEVKGKWENAQQEWKERIFIFSFQDIFCENTHFVAKGRYKYIHLRRKH